MNSSNTLNMFINPFLMWSRLAWKAGEMAIASAQVTGPRTRHLALAGSVTGTRDQREFALMGREKGEVALESAHSVGLRMLVLHQQFAAFAFKQMLSATSALMSIAASRNTAQTVERQPGLVRDTTKSSAVAVSKLSGSTARLSQRALIPVRARVSKNVRRLPRRSK